MYYTSLTRSTEENLKLASTQKKQFSVARNPLFPSIPLHNVVIDNLHLFLRVSDVLVDLLLGKLVALDGLAKSHEAKVHVARFVAFVASIGISGFDVQVESSKMKWRTFTGLCSVVSVCIVLDFTLCIL